MKQQLIPRITIASASHGRLRIQLQLSLSSEESLEAIEVDVLIPQQGNLTIAEAQRLALLRASQLTGQLAEGLKQPQ